MSDEFFDASGKRIAPPSLRETATLRIQLVEALIRAESAESALAKSEAALAVAVSGLEYVQNQLQRVEPTPCGHGLPAPGMAWVIASDTARVVDRLRAEIAKLRGDAKEKT